MDTTTSGQRESLHDLLRMALEEFPEPEHETRIRDYVKELSLLMDTTTDDSNESTEVKRAKASCSATREDVVTLLYKFEDFLEAVLVGRVARNAGR